MSIRLAAVSSLPGPRAKMQHRASAHVSSGKRRVTVTDYVKAWQCIGCGKIEAPQTCVGICQDRRVEFVYASDYEEALARVDDARQRAATLEAIVRQLATIMPRDGEWERSYRALQDRARQALADRNAPEPPSRDRRG